MTRSYDYVCNIDIHTMNQSTNLVCVYVSVIRDNVNKFGLFQRSETNRQRYTQTHKHKNKHTEIQRDTERERVRYRDTYINIYACIHGYV